MNSNHLQSNSSREQASPSSRTQIPASWSPPIVYGELSILGHNGHLHTSERSGRRNKSKFLLCKRSQPNGIKKSRHYVVKQPQEIQEKNLHSIAYTFSKSQTIVVEYKQDEHTDMFQIGRSSEEPIDFVVMDTHQHHQSSSTSSKQYAGASVSNHHSHHGSSNQHHQHHQHHLSQNNHANNQYSQPMNFHHHNENASSSRHPSARADLVGSANSAYHRRITKVSEEMHQYGYPARIDNGSAVLINYPREESLSNMSPMLANHYRLQNPASIFHHHQQAIMGHSSGAQQPGYLASLGPSHINGNNSSSRDHGSSRHQRSSHTTQSTISRFACRILVDREPPYTARIYAAGFDSSKNIFLGEKATKWEQNNSIDGLTTNGVLIMKPKRGYFYEGLMENAEIELAAEATENGPPIAPMDDGDTHRPTREGGISSTKNMDSNMNISEDGSNDKDHNISISEFLVGNSNGQLDISEIKPLSSTPNKVGARKNDSNNNNPSKSVDQPRQETPNFEYGGVWREVSVDGGIYAIRESRSAVQKGKRIENETNILTDGTLIDLCGATLLWRSLNGFRAAPTKKMLEDKIDLLNTSRPQCPVGLNTLVIPKKPILPGVSLHHHHHSHHLRKGGSGHHGGSSDDKNIQPYIYPCGHVQGGHNWGATEKTNHRTCPICMASGNVTKLSAGLEPSFYVDSGPLTHAFTQCGHMASEKTVQYWSSTLIPHGTHFFHSICPFCATPLPANEKPFTKLIFQEDLD